MLTDPGSLFHYGRAIFVGGLASAACVGAAVSFAVGRARATERRKRALSLIGAAHKIGEHVEGQHTVEGALRSGDGAVVRARALLRVESGRVTERAGALWVDTDDGAIALDGAIELLAGTREGAAALSVERTVYDGDRVRVQGSLEMKARDDDAHFRHATRVATLLPALDALRMTSLEPLRARPHARSMAQHGALTAALLAVAVIASGQRAASEIRGFGTPPITVRLVELREDRPRYEKFWAAPEVPSLLARAALSPLHGAEARAIFALSQTEGTRIQRSLEGNGGGRSPPNTTPPAACPSDAGNLWFRWARSLDATQRARASYALGDWLGAAPLFGGESQRDVRPGRGSLVDLVEVAKRSERWIVFANREGRADTSTGVASARWLADSIERNGATRALPMWVRDELSSPLANTLAFITNFRRCTPGDCETDTLDARYLATRPQLAQLVFTSIGAELARGATEPDPRRQHARIAAATAPLLAVRRALVSFYEYGRPDLGEIPPTLAPERYVPWVQRSYSATSEYQRLRLQLQSIQPLPVLPERFARLVASPTDGGLSVGNVRDGSDVAAFLRHLHLRESTIAELRSSAASPAIVEATFARPLFANEAVGLVAILAERARDHRQCMALSHRRAEWLSILVRAASPTERSLTIFENLQESMRLARAFAALDEVLMCGGNSPAEANPLSAAYESLFTTVRIAHASTLDELDERVAAMR